MSIIESGQVETPDLTSDSLETNFKGFCHGNLHFTLLGVSATQYWVEVTSMAFQPTLDPLMAYPSKDQDQPERQVGLPPVFRRVFV